MTNPNEMQPPEPTPFEALVRRLAEEANTPQTVTTDDLLRMGRLTSRYLERFARLVAEDCARLCEETEERLDHFGDPIYADESAAAIRAKFKEPT